MQLRRRSLVVALSVRRARLVQWLDGRRGAVAVAGALGGLLQRPPPRAPRSLAGRVADLARPLRWPQRGTGRMAIDGLPPVDSSSFRRLVARARRRRAVGIAPDLLDDESSRQGIAVLAASGAPLVLAGGGRATDGDALVAVLQAPSPRGTLERELHSVRLRRVAHDELYAELPTPVVSVLLASRRPADIDAAIDQIRHQQHADVQIVVGLHGDQWPADAEARLGRLSHGSVVRRFAAELPLGSVLDALVDAADGDLVTKWDDDDWYGSDHVADLVRAYRYSGAEVVGKAAEFVRLEASDLTIRRFAIGAEAYSTTLAGGTLLTTAGWLREVGGWTPVPRGVDRALIEATRRHRGRTYRTHGFQYVLRRREEDRHDPHTWAAGDAGFAVGAQVRRAGLDLAIADIRPAAPSPSARGADG